VRIYIVRPYWRGRGVRTAGPGPFWLYTSYGLNWSTGSLISTGAGASYMCSGYMYMLNRVNRPNTMLAMINQRVARPIHASRPSVQLWLRMKGLSSGGICVYLTARTVMVGKGLPGPVIRFPMWVYHSLPRSVLTERIALVLLVWWWVTLPFFTMSPFWLGSCRASPLPSLTAWL